MRATKAVLFPALSGLTTYVAALTLWLLNLPPRYYGIPALAACASVLIGLYFIITHSPADEIQSVKDFFRRF